MSRNASGTYTLPAGNPVDPGEIIESAWANSTMGDIATALTDSLSRTGLGGMLSPFENASGTITAPGITWTAEPTSGWYRKALNEFWYAIGGLDIFGIRDDGIVLADGMVAEGITTYIRVQDDEPTGVSDGEQWFESDTGNLYMRYQNPDDTFTWVGISSSGGDAISPNIIDAKGDLIVGTAADTPAVLTVGANDTILVADSAEATGLKYETIAANLGYTPANKAGETFTGAVNFDAAVTMDTTLGVTGAATLSSTLAVTGTSTFTGNVTANGAVSLIATGAEGLRIANNNALLTFYNTGASDRSGYISFINASNFIFNNEESTGYQFQLAASPCFNIANTSQAVFTNNGVVASHNSSLLTVNHTSGLNGFAVNNQTGGGGSMSAGSFNWAGTQVGSIGYNNTATSFNTSSDARLKTNITPLTGAGAIIDALKPSAFDWIKTGARGVGFIAQELYAVAPEAVKVGSEDADTDPWAVDFAKLVPYLVAEVKALRARVAALEGN